MGSSIGQKSLIICFVNIGAHYSSTAHPGLDYCTTAPLVLVHINTSAAVALSWSLLYATIATLCATDTDHITKGRLL